MSLHSTTSIPRGCVEGKELEHIVDGNMKCSSCFEKQPVNTYKTKLSRYMYTPSQNIKRTRIYKDIYSRTFIAALLLGEKLEAKLMPVDKGMAEEIWFGHTVEYYAAVL